MLQKLQAKYDELFGLDNEIQSLAGVGYWKLDIPEDALFWSKQVYTIFEIDPDVFKATYEAFLELVHPDDRTSVNHAYMQSLVDKTEYQIEHRILLDTGKVKYVRERCNTCFNEMNQPVQSVGIIMDITQQVETEKKLRETVKRAMESEKIKSYFLQNISHEVRTPLNSIIGFSELISKKSISEEKKNQFSKMIIESSYLLLHKIDTLIELSTLETGNYTPVFSCIDFKLFLRSIISFFNLKSRTNNIAISLVNPQDDEICELISDEKLLRNILLHLISQMSLCSIKGNIQISYSLQNQDIILSIIDLDYYSTANSAVWADKEIPLPCTNHEGLDMAYYLIHDSIQMLGGKVIGFYKDDLGLGYSFSIPRTEKNEALSDNKTNSTQEIPTVLIADDLDINFILIQEYIQYHGYEVKFIVAQNGLEAIDLCKNNFVSLVFMDLQMPILSGVEASKKIKELNPKIPIVAMTGYSIEEIGDKLVHFTDYITKPINGLSLLYILKKYL